MDTNDKKQINGARIYYSILIIIICVVVVSILYYFFGTNNKDKFIDYNAIENTTSDKQTYSTEEITKTPGYKSVDENKVLKLVNDAVESDSDLKNDIIKNNIKYTSIEDISYSASLSSVCVSSTAGDITTTLILHFDEDDNYTGYDTDIVNNSTCIGTFNGEEYDACDVP